MLKDNRGLDPGHHVDALCGRWGEDYACWQHGGVGESGTREPGRSSGQLAPWLPASLPRPAAAAWGRGCYLLPRKPACLLATRVQEAQQAVL